MDIITILEKKKKYIKLLYVVGLIVLVLDVFLFIFFAGMLASNSNHHNIGHNIGMAFGQLFIWMFQIILFILEIICLIIYTSSKSKGYILLLIINIISIMVSLFLALMSLQFGDFFSLVTPILLIIITVFIFQIRGIYKQIDTPFMSNNQPFAQNTQPPGSISEQSINQTQYSDNQMSVQNMKHDNEIIDLNNLTPDQKEQLLAMLVQNNHKN